MKVSFLEIAPRIVVDERVRFWKPVIKGTRVPVDLILSKLAGGMIYEELMVEYDLTREDIFLKLAIETMSLRAKRSNLLNKSKFQSSNVKSNPKSKGRKEISLHGKESSI